MSDAFALIWHWLLAYGIALARPLALVSLNPVFTRGQLTGLVRGAVASAIALPMVPHVAALLAAPRAMPLLLLTIKEAALGASLGLLLGAPFWALSVAGDVMDAQRGATQGRLNDPAGFEDVSITGTLLIVTGVTLFVITGGLQTLSGLLYDSWAIWPPLAGLPPLGRQTPRLLLGVLDRITREGLLLAMPPILAMLLADVSLMVVTRVAPSLRIDDLALAVRNAVFVVFMPLYVVFLIFYMRQDQGGLPEVMGVVRHALEPGAAP